MVDYIYLNSRRASLPVQNSNLKYNITNAYSSQKEYRKEPNALHLYSKSPANYHKYVKFLFCWLSFIHLYDFFYLQNWNTSPTHLTKIVLLSHRTAG